MSKTVKTKSGHVLDEAYLAEAIDVFEHSDPSEWVAEPAPPLGRPALHGGTGASPRFTLRVEPDVLDRAKAHAERDGRTLAEVTREFLREYATAQ